jgi:hypothetical protein
MNPIIAAGLFLLIGFGVSAKVLARFAKLMVDERRKKHVEQNPPQGSSRES